MENAQIDLGNRRSIRLSYGTEDPPADGGYLRSYIPERPPDRQPLHALFTR